MKQLTLGGLLLVAILVISGCSSDSDKDATAQDKGAENKQENQAAPQTPPMQVEAITVNMDNVPIWVEYTGKTEASQKVEVRARVSGRLEQVLFKEGDVVEKGQKLFVIEKAKYEAAVEQAKAKLESDQAALKLAHADVERYRPLVKEGLAPRVTLEQNEARVAELNAAVKADKSVLEDAELNLSYTDVTAPMQGKISRTSIDIGNIVGFEGKTLLTTIIADDPMHAYFNPSEEQYQLIQKYKSKDILDARVSVPDSQSKLLQRKPFRGVVDFKDNKVDSMTGTITMRATVDNPDRLLLEGTFVYVNLFITDKPSFLMVPPALVQEDQRGSFVYVVDENSSAKRVDIKRGMESRYYTVVSGGLTGGEQLISSALAKVKQGTKVEPQDVTETKGVMAILNENNLIPQ